MYEKPYHTADLKKYAFLITGGAGFIGSNLVEYLMKYKAHRVRVLDNLSTGHKHNLKDFLSDPAFEFIEGDIRDLETCKKAVADMDFVFHQAALGSVPRSIVDPITTNEVNISGFVNMLVAVKDSGVSRMVYAASSSTYGDSEALPKVEENIGNPLSPYAVTKYVNELYANVFARTYGMELIGLRYFNVFGPRQDPDGAYAAVVPKFVQQLLNHQSPVINGDGEHSRDFTFIENVVQANMLAMFTDNPDSLNTVYNVAYGEQTSLNQLVRALKEYLSVSDAAIAGIKALHGPNRDGDIPHSLASIEKAKANLNYLPQFNFKEGLRRAIDWYKSNLHYAGTKI
ncbi:MAG: SDR family oxidoreductase [Bacteroidota bacterium]|nr:SDR family oxidoreductase [Bacteroidota bacterium]MDP4214217.1 SDR family oxidoreductase [Bacteroidota bacterium]MDP4251149.1 SDR family oxidoreductase [Bacteroidota bacterium]